MLTPQSTHRVAMADFWSTVHHDGKISPGCWGWGEGARPSPFTLFTITNNVAVYAPAERADTLPVFHLYPICTLWLAHRLYVTLSDCQQTQYLNIKLHCCGSPHLSTRVYDPHKTIQKFYNSRPHPPTPPHHRTPSHRGFKVTEFQDTKIRALPIKFR